MHNYFLTSLDGVHFRIIDQVLYIWDKIELFNMESMDYIST